MTGSPSSAEMRASSSPTCRLSASSSSTHGPAIRKNDSNTLRTRLDGRLIDQPHAALAVHRRTPLDGGADERREQRMRTHGARLQLRVELAGHEIRMFGQLDHFHEIAVRRDAAEAQTLLGQDVA